MHIDTLTMWWYLLRKPVRHFMPSTPLIVKSLSGLAGGKPHTLHLPCSSRDSRVDGGTSSAEAEVEVVLEVVVEVVAEVVAESGGWIPPYLR
jgi:hypothetical protein